LIRIVASLLILAASVAHAQGTDALPGLAVAYGGRLAKARASNWPECVRILEPLAKAGVEDRRVLVRFGQCLSMVGESSRAERVLRRCVELNPGFEPCLNDLGAVLMDETRRDEAMKVFERAVEVGYATGRYSASVEWIIGEYLRRNDLRSARRYLRAAWSLAPDAKTRARLQVLEARFALASGNGGEALRRVDSALVTRNVRHYHILRSLVLAWLGRFDDAAAEMAAISSNGGGVSPLNHDLVWLAPGAFTGRANVTDLSGLVNRFEADQRPWFLAAAAAHVQGREKDSCELLARARDRVEGSHSLLAPPWASCSGNTHVKKKVGAP